MENIHFICMGVSVDMAFIFFFNCNSTFLADLAIKKQAFRSSAPWAGSSEAAAPGVGTSAIKSFHALMI